MNLPKLSRRSLLLSCGVLALAPRPSVVRAADAKLPGDSVYNLRATLTDQDGRALEWSSLRGQPVLASMFYTSCDMVCPMIFETLRWTLEALPAAEREPVKVLMVSFDPERDTVPVLKKTAQSHGCDARWTLARCDADTARKVAAALGIQYRRLASGEFNHSSTIELLDADGRIAARSGKLGAADPAIVKAVHSLATRRG
jgi:protein SCO1/2